MTRNEFIELVQELKPEYFENGYGLTLLNLMSLDLVFYASNRQYSTFCSDVKTRKIVKIDKADLSLIPKDEFKTFWIKTRNLEKLYKSQERINSLENDFM